MRRGGTFIFLLLGLGLLGVALWAASYARVTVGRFPWPGGTGQTRDRAFLILVDGRLALVRQSLQIVLSEQGVLVREDFDREPKEGQGSFVAADARTLGTFIARQSI